MEKLVYLVWKAASLRGDELRNSMLGEIGPRLLETTAGPVSIDVLDAEAEAVGSARITRMESPLAGAVNLWLDSVDERGPVETLLGKHVERLAGYLVTESVPIRNTTHRAPRGERTPGITLLTCIERPERLEREEWLAFWQGHHTPMANEVQCTYLYTRNVVTRPLTPDAPPWEGIVEEGFPTEAVTDPMLWYKADGSKEKLQENLGRMLDSVRHFLDIDRVESHPMSEYVLRDWDR